MAELTLGSLFDGLGGWQLAALHNGVRPVWSSEIEAFPMAVTKKHFPDTLQLGDITKLDGATLPPVDIICAGSPCFVAGTNVQTKNGIKPIENIVVGDMVIADDCGWHKVVEVMKNQTESVYTIKAQGLLELEATGNHPFLVKHMKRYYPTKNGKRCNLRKFSKAEWVKVENLQKGDFVGYPILQTSENTMSITKEEAWLIGRYIADGYTNNSQRQGRPLGQKNHKVIYCIGKGKLDDFKSKISQYHVCYKKDVTVTKGEIISERLMRLCMLCGKGAEHKEIPGIFLDLPKELLQELINGYVSGDGSKTGNLYRATTISKKLALSLQAAIHKTYQRPAKVYYDERPKKTTIQGREVNQKDTYTVTWLDDIPKQSQAIVEDGYIWQPIREIKRKEQKTIVYNFEVADVHSYTANGIIVHNCQDLSVAGKRKGLDGERSGLFRKAIDIVRGMRTATNGEFPKFFIWENVCFAKSTLISTQSGFKEIQDVVVGDKVLTKSGQYHEVEQTFITKKQMTLKLQVCGAETITVTPRHPFWVKQKEESKAGLASWKCAEELRRGDWIAYRTDGFGEKTIGKPFAYAVGRWLADGSIVQRDSHHNGSRGGQRYRIFISTGYKKFSLLKEELSKLPYRISENKMKHAVNFTFSSDYFAKLIESCGKGALNKRLPEYVFQLPFEEQKELLRGYLDGDGYLRRKNEVSCCTASRHLAYGLARLVRNIYHVGCGISYSPPRKCVVIENRIVKSRGAYNCYFSIPSHRKAKNVSSYFDDGFVWCRVKNIENGELEDVYNLSVSRDNTYCANGVTVHNCGAFSTNQRHDFQAVLEEITETKIPMPVSGQWAEAGMVRSRQCDVAWRVLDAQYWGVPQRRKRIFLIADFRDQQSRNTAVLFEPESLPRNTAPGRGKGQGTAAGAESDTGITSSFEPGITVREGRKLSHEVSTTLRANMGDNQTTVLTASIKKQQAYSFDSMASNSMKSSNPQSGCRAVDVAKTLDTSN